MVGAADHIVTSVPVPPTADAKTQTEEEHKRGSSPAGEGAGHRHTLRSGWGLTKHTSSFGNRSRSQSSRRRYSCTHNNTDFIEATSDLSTAHTWAVGSFTYYHV